ncbi:MAG: hypothetical protein IKY83_11730 [Proteobacteria bacterium]|nr:hypothetical protein [Pseudomonadota bacterium]
MQVAIDCGNKAWYRKLDESCDIYIPSSESALMLTRTKSTYKADKYWGLALKCGDTIHDLVSMQDMTVAGAERMCPDGNSLGSIKATGETVKDKYQGNSYSDLYSSANETYSPKLAVCGRIIIN